MHPHRTCGEPDEIKKNTHPKNITALPREQAVAHDCSNATCVHGVCIDDVAFDSLYTCDCKGSGYDLDVHTSKCTAQPGGEGQPGAAGGGTARGGGSGGGGVC